MNEYIEIRFFRNGKRLKVKRQVSGGIEFDERDPIERTVGIGFTHRNEATRVRLDNIRRIQGWPPGQFDLKMSVEDGSIILRGVNPHALPEGFYKVRVQIEEVKRAGGWASADVPHDESDVVDIELTMDDRSVSVDLTECDELVGGVLEQSQVDGLSGTAWVADDTRRATRRACLMNLLASLRVRPRLGDPLLGQVDHVFRVANDRIYARVDKAFLQTLTDLAKDEQKPFYEEGEPHAAIHQQLFTFIDEPPDVKAQFTGLCSFRGEAKAGTPSLQTVVAIAPPNLPYTYAEFDLDLGNPLQDLLGFFVHMGELLDGKATNHLDLRTKLQQSPARDFLYYRVVSA